MILFVLGILGEYIWRTLEESRKRPTFIIDELKRGSLPSANGEYPKDEK